MTIDCAFYATVVRDAEAKTSKAGKPYLRFTARDGDGAAVQWIGVMYFGADAPDLAPKMLKGARCYVEGQLRLDTWEQQDGTKRSGLSVMSFHCRIPAIGRNKPKKESAEKPTGASAPQDKGRDFHDDEMPF